MSCRGSLLSLAGTNGIVVSVLFFQHPLRVTREVQAGSLGKGRCSSGTSSPSGGENKHHRNADVEMQQLREELKRYKNAEKKQEVQSVPAGEEGGLEVREKMEVDREVDSKTKLDQRKKEVQEQLRDLEMLTICAAGTFRAGSEKSGSNKFKI